MQLDFPVGVGENLTEVKGIRSVGRLAGAGISHMKPRPLHGCASHAVLLVDGQFRGLMVLEHQFLFLSGVQGDGLGPGRVQVGKVVGGRNRQLRDPVAAGLHPQGDSAILAGGHVMLVVAVDALNAEHGAGDWGGGVGRVYLGDGELRLFVVLKVDIAVPVGLEGDELAGRVQQVGLRDTFLNDLINDGQQILNGRCAVRPGGHLSDCAAISSFDDERHALYRLIRIGVSLVDGEAGAFVIFQAQFRSPAGGQLHMVLRGVQNMIRQGCNFRDGVNTGLQVRNQNLAVFIGGAVQIAASVLNLGNAEGDASQRGAVRAGFDQLEGWLLGVGKDKLSGIIGPKVNNPLGVVDHISLTLQLGHHIGAGGQVAQVDFSVGIRGELLGTVAPIHCPDLKHRAGDGLGGIGAVHLDQLHTGLHVVEEN